MKLIYAMLAVTTLSMSCSKAENPLPNVAIDFQASIYSSAYSKLQGVNEAVTVSGYGVAGLIIYHELDGSYACYDRCSTYNPAQKCAVNIDSNELTATDPCSGSIFALTDGSVQKAPAKYPLKSYSITIANGVITVLN